MNGRRLARVLTFAASCAFVPAAASASGIAEFVKPQPDSPIQISSCGAGVEFLEDRFGIHTSYLNTAVDFKNVSQKTAVAVLFRLRLMNAFDRVLDDLFGQTTGQFAADTEIKGNHWSQTDQWAGIGQVECSVDRVRFSDGSDWVRPDVEPAPSEAPSPSPTAGAAR